MVAIRSYIIKESSYIVGLAKRKRSMTEKNGNKSAMCIEGQAIDRAEKPKDYKAFRLSVAPMMDWTWVTG